MTVSFCTLIYTLLHWLKQEFLQRAENRVDSQKWRPMFQRGKGANENFSVFCTETAYDVIIFKFQGVPPPCAHVLYSSWSRCDVNSTSMTGNVDRCVSCDFRDSAAVTALVRFIVFFLLKKWPRLKKRQIKKDV